MKSKTIWFLLPLLCFAALALAVGAGWTADAEQFLYEAAVRPMSPALTAVVEGITHLGDAATVIPFCLMLWIIPRSRQTIALPISLTVAMASGCNMVLKRIFARERPNILRLVTETSYSFPSGHAMTSAALYTALILLTAQYVRRRTLRTVLIALWVCLALGIGFSRVYLGVHHAGDIVGGWLLGGTIGAGVYHLHRWEFSA